MYKAIKTISFLFAAAIIIIATSCLNTSNDTAPRTPETEQKELDEALAKIINSGYKLDTTELGIYYVTNTEGEGFFPQAGDTLFVEYTGLLLNGSIFDASINHYTDGIWEMVYKENDLIPGFDDGLALLNKGAELDLIIPSEFAYGERSSGIILPYSTLIFSTKMHDIKPKQD